MLKIERAQFIRDQDEYMKSKEHINLIIKDLEEAESSNLQTKVNIVSLNQKRALEDELDVLQSNIGEKEQELKSLLPRFDSLIAKEHEYQARYDFCFNLHRLDACNLEREALISKQGRSAQFKTQRDRDVWLKKEIESIQESYTAQEENLNELREEHTQLKMSLETAREEIARVRSQLANRRETTEKLQQECEQARIDRNKLDEKRKQVLFQLIV
jgi:structural maintenance of chromosome 3 (chondroitin sulfate proteoglycan 6)